ncbi:MAG: hypothetical protein JWR06_1932, partial [Jatrophihabitans sp.]|nr:hypothetical protein [Jatrophihabitans sp.]
MRRARLLSVVAGAVLLSGCAGLPWIRTVDADAACTALMAP